MTEVFDCNHLRDALLSGASLDDLHVRAHVQGCAGCAELMAEDASLGHALAAAPAPAPESDLSGMLSGLDGALAQEQSKLTWLRNRPTAIRIAAVVVALLIALAVIVPFLSAGLPQAHADFAASLAGAGDDLIPRAFACFRYGVILSLPVFAVAAFADRGALRMGALPVLLGAAAGLIGVVALELHCPITEPVHLLVGHATVAACLALIALGIGALHRRGSA